MIHVREQGTGPVLLLLHGFCEDLTIWDGAFQYFASRYRVIAVDLPGFGKSSPIAGGFSLDEVGTALDQWRLQQGIHEAIVIAHSLGGYVGLAMAKISSDWILGLVLFHSTALPDSEEKKKSRDKVAEFLLRNGSAAWTDNFIPALFRDPGHPAIAGLKEKAGRIPAETLVAYTRAMRDRNDSVDFLASVPFPVAYIAGRGDTAVPYESVLQQQKSLPRAKFYVVEEIGHMGMLEAPDECFGFVSGWLEQISRPGGV